MCYFTSWFLLLKLDQYLHWELRMFQTEKCKCIKSDKVLDLYLVGGGVVFSRKFRKIFSLFFFIEYIYKFIKNNTAFFLGVLFILKGLNVSTEYRTMFVKKLSYVQRKLLYNRHNCLTCSFKNICYWCLKTQKYSMLS